MPVKFDAQKFRQDARKRLAAHMDKDIERRAQNVAAAARASTAFTDRTGDLRGSIRAVKRPSNPMVPVWSVVADAVHDGVAYGKLVEMGHAKRGVDTDSEEYDAKDPGQNVPPHPFLVPALQAARD